MRYTLFALAFAALLLVSGCNFEGPEERAIGEMVKTFVSGLDKSDDDIAEACLLDMKAFQILNPSASARTDAESFMEEYMADLVQSYRDLKYEYQGKDVKFKKFILGTPFYQYKGHSAFKDNLADIEVNGIEETINIMKIVRVGDRWLIVSLGANDSEE